MIIKQNLSFSYWQHIHSYIVKKNKSQLLLSSKDRTTDLKFKMSHNEFNAVEKTKVQIILLNYGIFYTPVQQNI